MRSLPIIELTDLQETQPVRRPKVDGQNPFNAIVVHSIRVAIVAMFVIGLHRYATSPNRLFNQVDATWNRVNIAEFVPGATRLDLILGEPSIRQAAALDGQSRALVAISSPMADHVIGYAGPTTLVLNMDDERSIRDVKVLRSFDTPEHLSQVVKNARFWQQFVGLRWGEGGTAKVDGVSGATLTSLAIAESMMTCLSSPKHQSLIRRSLKFPDELSEDEKQTWALRTGPLSDDISGYQGPTELLFKIDANDLLIDVKIRSSFDNEPYVEYARQERSFWKKFKGRSIANLAMLDLDAEQIDGVSGATMTSNAVAETIREASKAYLSQQVAAYSNVTNDEKSVSRARHWNFSSGEILTIILTIAAIFWSGSKLRGNRRARLLWQIICFIVIALVSGNLLSISLFSGWTRGGISYRLAPGLTLLLVVAFMMAILLKRNVYCDHLCPHGILQQWIRPVRKQHGPIAEPIFQLLTSKKCVQSLSTIAWVSIVIGFLTLIQPTGVNLSWLEPFDAYLLGFGFSISLIVWTISLIASRLSPLYYCRHACPTGKVLSYARRDRQRNRLTLIDVTVLFASGYLWLTLGC